MVNLGVSHLTSVYLISLVSCNGEKYISFREISGFFSKKENPLHFREVRHSLMKLAAIKNPAEAGFFGGVGINPTG
ncbi:hypothetical protein DN33_3064 [Vibrio cholerae]|nr:hypothetical protein DN33_3064 [Vibrio cholerae]